MADIVVLGAGLGGVIQAYEVRAAVNKTDKVTVINKGSKFHFVPSNPWVAVDWRKRDAIEVDLKQPFARKNIELEPGGAKRVHPEENAVELMGGRKVPYDYLIIATGPELAFDEIEGLGPERNSQSICHVDHAEQAKVAFEKLAANPGPIVVGAVQGASCFGPAYEFAFILDTELKKRKIRDKVPMMFVTSEPYIGHLGLDGVGDTKSLLESEMRDRNIRWITNAKIKSVEADKVLVEEVDDIGEHKRDHEVPSNFTMLLPAFKGVEAVFGIEGLTNPRGFIIVDEHQQNPKYPNIFGIGVGVAIPPIGPTPVPVGVPKTGFMIESMVTATAMNIASLMKGEKPRSKATWNAVCLADFGDGGVAFVARPQIPPRNVNWAAKGKWVHLAKIGFEKYFLGKVKSGNAEPFYEKMVLDMMGITKLKEPEREA